MAGVAVEVGATVAETSIDPFVVDDADASQQLDRSAESAQQHAGAEVEKRSKPEHATSAVGAPLETRSASAARAAESLRPRRARRRRRRSSFVARLTGWPGGKKSSLRILQQGAHRRRSRQDSLA